MGERGPKKKPTEIAKRDGTRPSRVPSPPLRTGVGATLQMPDYYNEYQKKAWEELVAALTDLDVLDNADAAVLETAAAMIGRMREARHELNGSEMIEYTQRGAAVPSPWWRIEKEAAQQVQRLLAELGLGPSARARLANNGAQSKKPEDALDALLGSSGRFKVLEGGK